MKNKGSATVEACVVVPVFLFFLLEISYFFMMIMADAHIHQSLAEASIYAAQYGYLEERMLNKDYETAADLIGTVIVAKQFRTYLGEDSMINKVVAGGKNGIIITSLPEPDNKKIYDVRADYAFKSSVPILGTRYVKKSEVIRQKAFVGFGKDELSKTDVYVYVTPNQSVYHMSRSCTYLALKVNRHLRSSGYPPCGFCGKDEYTGVCYIAENGRVYHNNLHCTGLKRTVSRVKKSAVPALKPCSRCAG